jgi:hypothetical protein
MMISHIQLKLLSILTLIAATAVAASAQVMPYRVADRQVRDLINRIETETNTFRADAQRDIDRSFWNGTNREDSMDRLLNNFDSSTNQLRNNFTGRRSSASDVQAVLNRAMRIDQLMRNNTFTPRVQNEWSGIRSDLDTLAGYYNVTSNWNNTGVVVTPAPGVGAFGANRYTATDRQMRTLANQLRYRASAFRNSFNRWSRRRGNTVDSNVVEAVADLSTALSTYSSNYSNTTARDLGTILSSAATIDAFVQSSNNLNYDVSSKWGLIRSNINTLTGYYGMTNWDWRTPVFDNTATGYPVNPNGNYDRGFGRGDFDSMITGTYRLNTSRSDNVNDVIDRNLGSYDANGRMTQHQWLERRLMSPDMIVVEKHGSQLQIASSNAQRVDLNVDGTRRTETLPNGRTMTTSVAVTGRELTVNYEGDRSNDFYVSFTPVGRGLQVSRRIYLQNSNKTVTVNSFYDKTDDVARWDAITYTNNNTAGYPTNNNGYPGYYGNYSRDVWAIPNSTQIIATLDTPLSTRTVRDGDTFQMTVTSPYEYSGAIIRGTAYGNRSGTLSGRANMSFNFDSIQLRNGQTYRFAGIVDGVRTLNGDTVSVNNEGQVRDTSRTNQTVERAGIGAALGAIIGAIAGGGSGAAIGAAVGAAAGGGSIVLQGRDNLVLDTGTEFRITATAPNRVGAP